MRRLGIAALVEDERPRRYVRLGRRVVNPKAVYGSQRDHARALYRRINGRPRATHNSGDLPLTTGDRGRAALGSSDLGQVARRVGPPVQPAARGGLMLKDVRRRGAS